MPRCFGSSKLSFPTFALLWHRAQVPATGAPLTPAPAPGPSSLKPETPLMMKERVLKMVWPRLIDSRRAVAAAVLPAEVAKAVKTLDSRKAPRTAGLSRVEPGQGSAGLAGDPHPPAKKGPPG